MAGDRLEVGHDFAPVVRHRARQLALAGALLGLALLMAIPDRWPWAALSAIALAGLAIAATRLSRVVVTVTPARIEWKERGIFPGLAHTVRIPREGVDQLHVGQRAPSLADRVTPVPATVRVAYPRNPEYAERVVPRRYQLWVIRGGSPAPLVEHPDVELLRAVARAAERLWGLGERRMEGELQR